MIPIHRRINFLKSQTALNASLTKNAELSMATVENAVKQITPGITTANVIDFIGPTIIGKIIDGIFKTSMLGTVVDFSLRIFNISLSDIVTDVCTAVTSLFKSDPGQITEESLQNTIDQAIKNTLSKTSDSQAESNYKQLKPTSTSSKPGESDQEDLDIEGLETISSNYAINKFLQKRAATSPVAPARLALTSVLSKVFGAVFKTIFKSVGMFGAAGAFGLATGVHTLLDKFLDKDPFTWTLKFDVFPSTLAKYPLNPSFSETPNTAPWSIFGLDGKDESALKETFIKWAQEIYQNVTPEEIRASEVFNELARIIRRYNSTIPQSNLTVFPEQFRTKKEVVNYFINDVAAKSTKPSPTTETKQ